MTIAIIVAVCIVLLVLGGVLGFYKLPVAELLVVHDELDLPTGAVRVKRGGGAGGHNGLKDLIAC